MAYGDGIIQAYGQGMQLGQTRKKALKENLLAEILAQNYQQATPSSVMPDPENMGYEPANVTVPGKPGGQNWENTFAQMYQGGLGPEAMQFEQTRDSNELAKLVRQAQLVKAMRPGGENGLPSAIQEWEYYNGKLSPEQKEQYLTMKRATKFLDTGDGYVAPSQTNPSVTKPVAIRNLKPTEKLSYVGDKKATEVQAEAVAEAGLELPKAEANAEITLGLIDELRKHPGRTWATGTSSVIPKVPGTPQADFIARLDQLKGKQFLEAFQMLKGGGAITEVEGNKAENALARMDRAQSEGEFLKSLDDFQSAVRVGTAKLRQKAGKAPAQATPTEPVKQQAPQAAIDYLKKNNTTLMRKEFQRKYGYLPDG